jgi:hypothetical protein
MRPASIQHDLFIQQTKLKNTLRWLMGEEQITHLGPSITRTETPVASACRRAPPAGGRRGLINTIDGTKCGEPM